MDRREADRLQRRQDGVISRRQVLSSGGDDLLIARLLRRHEWARVHEGVYVDHTGPLTRRQREWAAVLLHHPAALAGRSALVAHGLLAHDARRAEVVEVVVDRSRRVRDPQGVRTRQVRRFTEVVLLSASPPRLRLEHAVLQVASRETREDTAVAVLADAVRSGHTTVERLSDTLDRLQRLPRRGLLAAVISDVGDGAESPLERRYLRDVERAHGLPAGERQVREVVQTLDGEEVSCVRRDVRYRAHATLVELDGRLGHSDALDRWADLDRDLVAAAHGSITLRAGWQQVLQSCRLAALVGGVLVARGWTGRPRPCDAGCVVRPGSNA